MKRGNLGGSVHNSLFLRQEILRYNETIANARPKSLEIYKGFGL